MFAQIKGITSSAIESLMVSPANNQAIVEFKNGKRYLYNNVQDFAIMDLLFGEIESLGKFVNAYCKYDLNNQGVIALNWFSN